MESENENSSDSLASQLAKPISTRRSISYLIKLMEVALVSIIKFRKVMEEKMRMLYQSITCSWNYQKNEIGLTYNIPNQISKFALF